MNNVQIPRVALLWQCFGPYHVARLRALIESGGKYCYVGIQVAGVTSTYAWKESGGAAIITLFPNEIAEEVSPWAMATRLLRTLKANRIDVLCVPSYWPGYALMALLIGRLTRRRVIVMSDSHFLSGSPSIVAFIAKRLVLKLCDSAFVAGSPHKAFFSELGVSPAGIFVGYDVVDNQHFGSRALTLLGTESIERRRLGLPERYFLSLGRFVEKKNLKLIVEAYVRYRSTAEFRGEKLVFVGEGIERGRVVDLAKASGLRVRELDRGLRDQSDDCEVLIFPFAQYDEIASYYVLADCLILASKKEEWGLVVNEALASGCPAIVSKSAGCAADLIVEGRTGYTFDPTSAEDLALRMWSIGADAVGYQVMRREAREWIKRYSLEGFSKNMESAVAHALSRHSGDHAPGLRDDEVSVAVLQTCFPDYREAVFAEAAERMGKGFELICGSTYFTENIKTARVRPHYLRHVHNLFFWRKSLLWQMGAVERLSGSQYAILELNPRVLSTWVVLIARRILNQRSFVWGHAWPRKGAVVWTTIVRLLMIRLSDGMICYTKKQAGEVRVWLPGMPVIAAPNSSIRKQDLPDLRKDGGVRTEVIYVGRLIKAKKVDLLLKGFALAREMGLGDARLTIVGDGDERRHLEESMREYGLEFCARFVGHEASREVLKEYYRHAFCAVSPGYVGLSAVQAYAHGVPLVYAKDEPHAPEIDVCIEGENSLTFRNDDAEDLARVLSEVWRTRLSWAQKQQDIQESISKEHCIESMVAGFSSAVEVMKVM